MYSWYLLAGVLTGSGVISHQSHAPLLHFSFPSLPSNQSSFPSSCLMLLSLHRCCTTHVMTPSPPLSLQPSEKQQPQQQQQEEKDRSGSLIAGKPEDIFDYIIKNLLPFLLLASLSVRSFTIKWRGLHSKITQLNSSLSSISGASSSCYLSHPLFPILLPPLLSTLLSLRSLFYRCNDPEIAGGKLLLQSDLDIASSSLDHHLHHLNLLLPFFLSPSPTSSSSTTTPTPVANAIVLSHPTSSSSKYDVSLFVRDLFARLAIGGLELKKKALESLLRLIEECGSNAAVAVTEEGDVSCLLHLLDSSPYQSLGIREQAVSAIAALVSTSEVSRKAVFEEGGVGLLLRLLDSGSILSREQAADSIETITSDPNNAWAIAAYGGIAVLIDSCRPCNGNSIVTRAKASGSLRNVIGASVGGEIKESMVEEGAVPVFVEMLGDDESEIRKNAAHCIWMLGSGGESFRVLILREGALPKLLHLFRECSGVVIGGNLETMEHVIRALHVLSSSSSASKTLSGSSIFLSQLADLIGQNHCQRVAVALLCNLSLNEDGKRVMAGCMGALVKMMMMDSPKPGGSQEVAAQALVLLLSVRSNRKELSRDEKSISRLVQMLDPKSNDCVCKKLPVSVVLSMVSGGGGGGTSGSGGCRKMILAAGACHHLQKLAEIDVPGAKKTLQRITGGRLRNLLSSISWRE